MIKAICLGGPNDGVLIQLDQVRPMILMSDPKESGFIRDSRDFTNTNLLNTPITVHKYEHHSIHFPGNHGSKLVFYFYKGPV